MRFIYVSICLFFLCLNLFAQSEVTAIEQGIKLYQNADYVGAINILQKVVKKSNDSKAWYFLGASYLKKGDLKNSQKSFDKAIKLDPQNAQAYVGLAYVHLKKNENKESEIQIRKAIDLNKQIAEAHYILGVLQYRDGLFKNAYESANKAININSNFANAYLLKSEALAQSFGILQGVVSKSPNENSELLKDAVLNLETFLKVIPQNIEAQEQRERLEGLKYFAEYYTETNKRNSTNDSQNETPLKVISQLRPDYTERARQAFEQGLIRVLVLFANDGKVKYCLVLNRLNYGLTEEAIKAAYKIKFVPATKNGQPISVVKTVEFRFSIY